MERCNGLTLLGLAVLLLGAAAPIVAAPASLMAVFSDANQHDPVYQAAKATYQATREALPQSIAPALPQLDLSAAIAREWDQTSLNGSGVYTTHNWGLTLSQTVFDLNVFQAISRANYTVQAAARTLAAAQQTLMIRTAAAYYSVLSAAGILQFTQQQVSILHKQLEQTKILYRHKEATITELEQARGAYYDIKNDLAAAKLALYQAKQNLSKVTAKHYAMFMQIKSHFPLITPTPNNVMQWVTQSTQQNLTLQSSRLTMSAAKKDISVQRSGYFPVVNAEGGYTQATAPTTSDGNLTTQRTKDGSVGLNLTWNAFSGGLTMSQVRQAIANYDKATSDMQNDYLTVTADTRSSFQGIVLGGEEIRNAKAAMVWNGKALIHAEEGYRSGNQTLTDILQIQSRLFLAQRKYVQDTFEYLNDILLLKQAAGTLSVKDLARQNAWLDGAQR